MTNGTQDATPSSRGKVARLIEEYDLPTIGDELESYWTASDGRMSLRQLSTYFNKAILTAALDEHDVTRLAGETDNIYELLTDDAVTSGVRTQAENRLREHGIDVEKLRSDFVSRQAIHTYLTETRGAEYDSENQDGTVIERRLEDIQRLKSRLASVTERSLSSLRNADRITLGQFQVLVSVRVQCTDCNNHYDVVDLLSQGGCNCS